MSIQNGKKNQKIAERLQSIRHKFTHNAWVPKATWNLWREKNGSYFIQNLVAHSKLRQKKL